MSNLEEFSLPFGYGTYVTQYPNRVQRELELQKVNENLTVELFEGQPSMWSYKRLFL